LHPDDAKAPVCRAAWRRGSPPGAGTIEARVEKRGRNKRAGLVFVPWFDESRLINKLTLDDDLSDIQGDGFSRSAAVRWKGLKQEPRVIVILPGDDCDASRR